MEKLRAEGLVKLYGKRRVVDGIDVEVGKGEIVGLLGPNGAGKTTTFYMIMGVIKPNAGRVFIEDQSAGTSTEITRMPMFKRARLGIGYLPQEASVFRRLTVWQNVYAVLEMRGFKRSEARARAEEVLEIMGVSHLAKQTGAQLSGGERRRVEIARALAIKPKFLLLDEPFVGIDPKTREEVQDIVKGLKSLEIGIVITDHNVRETLEVTDRSYIIYEGKILLSGTADVLVNDPEARKVYLGERFKM
ncbi:MAG: LPS export ABC transporter ATP-binding protein [candidate division WOR-3 bacterium]